MSDEKNIIEILKNGSLKQVKKITTTFDIDFLKDIITNNYMEIIGAICENNKYETLMWLIYIIKRRAGLKLFDGQETKCQEIFTNTCEKGHVKILRILISSCDDKRVIGELVFFSNDFFNFITAYDNDHIDVIDYLYTFASINLLEKMSIRNIPFARRKLMERLNISSSPRRSRSRRR